MRIVFTYGIAAAFFTIGVSAAYLAYLPFYSHVAQLNAPNELNSAPPQNTVIYGTVGSVYKDGRVILQTSGSLFPLGTTFTVTLQDPTQAKTLQIGEHVSAIISRKPGAALHAFGIVPEILQS